MQFFKRFEIDLCDFGMKFKSSCLNMRKYFIAKERLMKNNGFWVQKKQQNKTKNKHPHPKLWKNIPPILGSFKMQRQRGTHSWNNISAPTLWKESVGL